ncbi:MAG: NADH-quinone oxidoreductase subunit N, partial [Flammeovirgaceae bacterium]|nr:NADH-quinone oxidoreductase subunit N [Flammeovirgaceae bacterium]
MLASSERIRFFKLFNSFAALLFLFFQHLKGDEKAEGVGEQYMLLFPLLLGLQLMVASVNLLMIFLSIELASICAYVLTVFKFRPTSFEAGIKYVLFGALSSAIMLYGMSWLYGFSGSLQLADIAQAIARQENPMLFLALLLTFGGVFFKISSFPFHLWTPDVYQVAPSSWVAFLSVAPKAAAFGIMINLVMLFSEYWTYQQQLFFSTLSVIAVASMLIGNLGALWQKSFKRLLAYSSIAHSGFMLLAIPTVQMAGFQSLTYYLVVYLFMNFAAFFLADVLEKQKSSDYLSQFQGAGMHTSFVGILTVVLMISLAGLPPTAGFTAKLLVFSALWSTIQQTQHQLLLVAFFLGVLNTALALFYYLKIPFFMFFRKNEDDIDFEPTFWQVVLLTLYVFPLLLLFFMPSLVSP